LTASDSIEEIRPFGRRGIQIDPYPARNGVVARNRPKSECASRLNNILNGAAQARERMVIVGIDGGQPAPRIGQHEDGAIREPKLPRLSVMAVGSQSGVTDKLSQNRCRRQIRAVATPPRRADCLLITGKASGIHHKRGCATNCGKSSSNCKRGQKPATALMNLAHNCLHITIGRCAALI
jgi:hypothetical protein